LQDQIRAYAYGSAIFDEYGNAVQGSMKITKLDIIESIKNGRRGLSPEIKIEWFQCNICKKNHEECPHDEGQMYEGEQCRLIPRDLEFLALSIVDQPKDERAKITDLLIIEKQKITWHGFPVLKEKERFQNIQSACKSGLISEKKAIKISEHFSLNNTGFITIE